MHIHIYIYIYIYIMAAGGSAPGRTGGRATSEPLGAFRTQHL